MMESDQFVASSSSQSSQLNTVMLESDQYVVSSSSLSTVMLEPDQYVVSSSSLSTLTLESVSICCFFLIADYCNAGV